MKQILSYKYPHYHITYTHYFIMATYALNELKHTINTLKSEKEALDQELQTIESRRTDIFARREEIDRQIETAISTVRKTLQELDDFVRTTTSRPAPTINIKTGRSSPQVPVPVVEKQPPNDTEDLDEEDHYNPYSSTDPIYNRTIAAVNVSSNLTDEEVKEYVVDILVKNGIDRTDCDHIKIVSLKSVSKYRNGSPVKVRIAFVNNLSLEMFNILNRKKNSRVYHDWGYFWFNVNRNYTKTSR